VGELADCTRLSPAATSHLVDRLVQLGLANRAEDTEDRRQKRVTASPDGVAMVRRLEQVRLERIGEAVGHLSPATRGKLAEAMQAVLDEASTHSPKEARR
jgi:DNA-binding MarR family transcriptional regulator